MDTSRATYLFQRYFNQTAGDDEKAELMEWISRDENVEAVKALMDQAWKKFQETEKVFTAAQSEAMLRFILQKDVDFVSPKPPLKKIRLDWLRTAAIAVILVAIVAGGFFWFDAKQPSVKAVTGNSSAEMKDDVAPGGNAAVLKLANGKTISLDSIDNGVLAQQGNTKIIKLNRGQLAYSGQQAGRRKDLPIQYNMLTTKRGGQYQLTLPDSTKVWLNATSSIRFPTVFIGKERKVEITGEVYFEVAQNPEMPFIVEANSSTDEGIRVEVLGTHFNLNTYKNEPTIKTTLFEGLVNVVKGTQNRLLRPGQQARITRGSASIKIENVDVEEVMAWKNGLFYFNGDDMASVMRTIARWYDVNVVYQGQVPSGHYTGIIKRNINLSQVLKVLELSGVQFEIEGRNLLVMSQGK